MQNMILVTKKIGERESEIEKKQKKNVADDAKIVRWVPRSIRSIRRPYRTRKIKER